MTEREREIREEIAICKMQGGNCDPFEWQDMELLLAEIDRLRQQALIREIFSSKGCDDDGS